MADTKAADGGAYLYEFLYRGRDPGSDQAPDYHVILAHDLKDAFGNVHTSTTHALTPGQAKDLGFDIAAIVAAVDAGTMRENAVLKTALEAAEGENAALQAKLDAASTRGADPMPAA